MFLITPPITNYDYCTANTIFKNVDDNVRRWMLTGTPFETSPGQLRPWLSVLQLSWDPHSDRDRVAVWHHRDEYRSKLDGYLSENMIRIIKNHLRFVNRKEFKNDEETTLHLKELGGVLKLLWPKRDAEKSAFWGYPLTKVLFNTHLTIQCQLPSHLPETVNKSGRENHCTGAGRLLKSDGIGK